MGKRKIGIEVEHAVMKGNLAIPASGQYGFDKDSPLTTKFGTIHEDGAMFEIAIDPTETAEQQYEYYDNLLKLSQPLLKPKNHALGLCSSLLYNEGALLFSEGSNRIGCSPSICAYRPEKEKHLEGYEDAHRFAGLHINVDYEGTDQEKYDFVKKLDYWVGLYSVANWEKDDQEGNITRRKFYGEAGNCRLTPFGVEYRTLPAMVWSKENCSKIYDLVDKAIEAPTLKTSNLYEKIINECDSNYAQEILQNG